MGSVYKRGPIKSRSSNSEDVSDNYLSTSPVKPRTPQKQGARTPQAGSPRQAWQTPAADSPRWHQSQTPTKPGRDTEDDDSDISDISDSLLYKSDDHNTTDERIYPDLPPTSYRDYDNEDDQRNYTKITPKKRYSPEPNILQSPDTTKATQPSSSTSYIVGFLIVLSIGLPLIMFLNTSKFTQTVKPEFNENNELTNSNNVTSHVLSQLETLKSEVGIQQEFVWKRIKSALKSVLAFKSRQPAVVTVLIPEKSTRTSHCIVRKVVNMVRSVFSDGADVTFSPASARRSSSMASQLQQHADHSLQHSRVWRVQGLEHLTFESVSLLMGYTDHDFAPYKRAVIFLELHVGEVIEVTGGRGLDVLVEAAIMDALRGKLKEDKILAIISRVSGRAVLFNTDNNVQLNGCED